MPVRIDKAGAHLEAYIETLPTINALRLCSRFGSGPQCHVSKLPVELVKTIERFIVEPVREEKLYLWSTPYRCFELRCDIIDDHFTREEQHELFHRYEKCKSPDTVHYSFNQESSVHTAAEIRAKLLGRVVGSAALWAPEHDSRARAWEFKAGLDYSSCIFTKQKALLRSHFGIDFWTANVRIPVLEEVHSKSEEWKLTESNNMSVAYMTLPNKGHTREQWASAGYDTREFQSAYVDEVQLGATPSQASLRRFSRALDILGLEVFIHPAHKRKVICTQTDLEAGDSADSVDESLTCWPQLTLLTRCHTEQKE
jgi:hypothetical protein